MVGKFLHGLTPRPAPFRVFFNTYPAPSSTAALVFVLVCV